MDVLRQFYNDNNKKRTLPKGPIEHIWQYPSYGEPLNNYTPKTRFRRIMYSLNGWSRVNDVDMTITKECKSPIEVIKMLKQNHLKCASVWRLRDKKPYHKALSSYEMDRCFVLFNQLKREKTYALTVKSILAYIKRSDLSVFLK